MVTNPKDNDLAAPEASIVAIPTKLIDTFRLSPVGIGLYALIAQIYQETADRVELSEHSVVNKFDPTVTRSSVHRGMQRLRDAQWIVSDHPLKQGKQSAYIPTWGVVKGKPRPWLLDRPGHGRPHHVACIHISSAIMDPFMVLFRPDSEGRVRANRSIASGRRASAFWMSATVRGFTPYCGRSIGIWRGAYRDTTGAQGGAA